MELGEAILAVGAAERPASFEQFSAAIDPEWIAQALAAAGTASLRRRKFPAEYAVWLVIGMGLFRDRAIAQVVQHLDLVLPTATARATASRTAPSCKPAIGLGPSRWRRCSVPPHCWRLGGRGRGRRALAGPGRLRALRIPDTQENEAHFGRPGTSRGGAAAATRSCGSWCCWCCVSTSSPPRRSPHTARSRPNSPLPSGRSCPIAPS